MRSLWPIALVVAVFGLMGLSTWLTPERGDSATALEAQTRIDRVPMTLGGWQGRAITIPEKQLRVAEAEAVLSRVYTRASDGASVTLLILAGRPGPLGAHTPETCFAGAGFAALSRPDLVELDGDQSVWRVRFVPPVNSVGGCDVAWGWAADDRWIAAKDARFDFAGRKLVYKVYVSSVVSPRFPDAGPLDEFLRNRLPGLLPPP